MHSGQSMVVELHPATQPVNSVVALHSGMLLIINTVELHATTLSTYVVVHVTSNVTVIAFPTALA